MCRYHTRIHYAGNYPLRNGTWALRSVCANASRTVPATIECGCLTENPTEVTCKMCRRNLPVPKVVTVTVTPQARSMGGIAARIHRAPIRARVTREQEAAALVILLSTVEREVAR